METNPILQIFRNWLQLGQLEFNPLGFCSLPVPPGMVLRVVDQSDEGKTLLFLEVAQIPPFLLPLVSGLVELANAAPVWPGGPNSLLPRIRSCYSRQIHVDNLASDTEVMETTADLVALSRRWREAIAQLPSNPGSAKDFDDSPANLTVCLPEGRHGQHTRIRHAPHQSFRPWFFPTPLRQGSRGEPDRPNQAVSNKKKASEGTPQDYRNLRNQFLASVAGQYGQAVRGRLENVFPENLLPFAETKPLQNVFGTEVAK